MVSRMSPERSGAPHRDGEARAVVDLVTQVVVGHRRALAELGAWVHREPLQQLVALRWGAQAGQDTADAIEEAIESLRGIQRAVGAEVFPQRLAGLCAQLDVPAVFDTAPSDGATPVPDDPAALMREEIALWLVRALVDGETRRVRYRAAGELGATHIDITDAGPANGSDRLDDLAEVAGWFAVGLARSGDTTTISY